MKNEKNVDVFLQLNIKIRKINLLENPVTKQKKWKVKRRD